MLRAMVPLPAPDGPSMAMINLRIDQERAVLQPYGGGEGAKVHGGATVHGGAKVHRRNITTNRAV